MHGGTLHLQYLGACRFGFLGLQRNSENARALLLALAGRLHICEDFHPDEILLLVHRILVPPSFSSLWQGRPRFRPVFSSLW